MDRMSAEVLIIEDHLVLQGLLEQRISQLRGYEVCGVASSGEEALALLEEIQTDLVLIDVHLPDGYGTEFVGVMLQRRPELFCVVMSGFDDAVLVKKALNAGAKGYLLKEELHRVGVALDTVLAGGIYLTQGLTVN